jgi:hypothetical protein
LSFVRYPLSNVSAVSKPAIKSSEQISNKDNSMAVGKNVGARPGACPMSAANKRSNLFNFEFNYPFERRSPLWAGTRPAPTFSVSFY